MMPQFDLGKEFWSGNGTKGGALAWLAPVLVASVIFRADRRFQGASEVVGVGSALVFLFGLCVMIYFTRLHSYLGLCGAASLLTLIKLIDIMWLHSFWPLLGAFPVVGIGLILFQTKRREVTRHWIFCLCVMMLALVG